MDIVLKAKIGRVEFDYQTLMSALSNYANPREKVSSLLRQGSIVRVKKGIYVLGSAYRDRPFSRELLANMIRGPSFVSFEYALSYHGLIPERVSTVTSATTKRSKVYDTPVGRFSYRHVPKRYFSVGMTWIEGKEVSFLMASPERALADQVRGAHGTTLRSQKAMADYLFDDMRYRACCREIHGC